MSSSDETFLEAFIEGLSTLPHELKRNLELMKDLDKSLLSKSEIMQQLQDEHVCRTEERVMQLKVVLDDDETTGGEPIGLRVPTAADDGGGDDAMAGVVVVDDAESSSSSTTKKKSSSSAKKKRKKDDDEHEEARIPTTEELWDYATGRVNSNDNNPQQQHHDDDNYRKIVQLQQECLQKADEKVAVAQQSYEIIDSVVQRLDRDLATMESLLQSMGDFQQGVMAKPNDLAACQVTPGSEWILAKVIQHDPTTGIYKLADEDVESNKIFQVPEQQVQVLHLVEKLRPGDEVYAVYPDTTSFYQATVVQAPRKQGAGSGVGGVGGGGGGGGGSSSGPQQFCMVNFVDDSDEFGVTHDKAVPLAHVMLPPYGSNM